MKLVKAALASLFVAGLIGLALPGSALAAKPAKNAKWVFGTVSAFTPNPGGSITVTTGSGDVTVTLGRHVHLRDLDSVQDDPQAGEFVAAKLHWSHRGVARAKKLVYSATNFAFRHHEFPGAFVSNTGDCTSGTLTIQGLRRHNPAQLTFNTDTNTTYENADAASDCASTTYTAGERVNVRGLEFTDGSWYAQIVDTNPA